MCEQLCPEVFVVGAYGIAEVLDESPDPSLWADVEAAAAGCPARAVFIEKD